MPMKITLLGTGSPTPSVKRAGSGYLVETESDVFVFDCGPGSYRRFLETGKQPTEVTQLFVTHWHYDHCTDLAPYILQRWDQGAGEIPELKVYGPQPIRRILEALFETDGVFDSDLEARTKNEASVALYHARGGRGTRERPRPIITEAEHGSEFRGDDWMVRAIEVPHAQPYLRCLAYRLDSGGYSLVYSGDSGPTDRMISFSEGADVLIHMCHYLTGTEFNEAMLKGCGSPKMIANLARDAGVKTVILTHITGQIDKPGVREQVISEVREIFQGTVVFGEDLTVVSPETIGGAGELL